VGTLVHRLFERHATPIAPNLVVDEVVRLLREEEAADVTDLPGLSMKVRESYLALSAQPVLAAALERGDALFEVPFSVRLSDAQVILRGTFDCLVRKPGGGVTVLELKTGKPLPEHQDQLATYLAAARAIFSDETVDGMLVYAHGGDG